MTYRMSRSRRALAIVGVTAACALVVGCSSDAPESPATSGAATTTTAAATSEAPAVEGPVTFVCNLQEAWCQGIAKQFTEETGIAAEFVRLNTGETLARLEAARSAPEFDVWLGGNVDTHIVASDQGLTEAYSSPSADAIPERFKAADGAWTGMYLGVLSMCSNTAVLEEAGVAEPTSWQDLLDPALKNLVAMAHPAVSGTAFTSVWTHVELNDDDVDAALAYFRQLHGNILQYPKTGGAPGQMAGRGEIAVGIVYAHDCQTYINEGFTEIKPLFPSEGTGYEIGAVSLVKNGNTAAGQAFVDWVLTPAAFDTAAESGAYQIPTNPEVPLTEFMVDLDSITLVDYDMAAAAAARADVTARFDAEVAQAPAE